MTSAKCKKGKNPNNLIRIIICNLKYILPTQKPIRYSCTTFLVFHYDFVDKKTIEMSCMKIAMHILIAMQYNVCWTNFECACLFIYVCFTFSSFHFMLFVCYPHTFFIDSLSHDSIFLSPLFSPWVFVFAVCHTRFLRPHTNENEIKWVK